MVGVGLHACHGTAIVTALPSIADDLAGRALYGAAISVYLVASIVGLAAAAGPVGRHGPLPVLGAGLGVFSIGLGVSAAAPDMAWLVAGRAVEGLGGGVISTVLYASVNLAFPVAARARILALLAAAWVIPTLGAPPLAAFVAETWGWRWVFVGLLPAVAFTWLCGASPLSQIGVAREARGEPAPAGVGIGRTVLLALGCGILLLAGSVVGPGRGARLTALALAGVGVAVVIATVDRVLPPGTLSARRGLPSAIALKTLLAMSFFGVETFLPLATTQLLGWSTLEAGWLLSGAGVTWTLGSFAEARVGGRADGRGALLGAAAVLAGLLIEGLALGAGVPRLGLYSAWWLAAFGMGVGYNVANSTAMAKTAPGDEGATSSALGISDSLGIALGSGIGGLLVAAGEAFGRPLAAALDIHLVGMVVVGLGAVLVARRLADPPAAPLGLAQAVAPPSETP
jgi:predicted MFS family arabinose efflux permease